ncbi:MAG: hypothetical protein K6B68_16725, partial [Eubacterium sp.]|nr:hypothetical protein [Eubacterium sp.]
YIGATVELEFRKAWYPEIISKEQFVRVNEKVKGKSRGKKIKPRIENIFGKIYYIDESNVLKFEIGSDLKNYPYFHKRRDRAVIITYEELETAIKSRLAEEKARCEKVVGYVESGRTAELIEEIDKEYTEAFDEYVETCERYAVERLALYSSSESGKVDSEEYRMQDEELLQKVKTLTKEFQDKTVECEERKQNLSTDNKWIKRYLKYTEDFQFTRKVAKELIERITVQADGSIEVKLYCDEADAFPADWRCN